MLTDNEKLKLVVRALLMLLMEAANNASLASLRYKDKADEAARSGKTDLQNFMIERSESKNDEFDQYMAIVKKLL